MRSALLLIAFAACATTAAGKDGAAEASPWRCSGGVAPQSDCAGLDQHDCEFHLPQFHLGRPPRRPPAAAVGSLLNTEFRRVLNAATGQSALRAGSFALPAGAAAAITAVFGVHGLPLPPKRNQVTAVTPGQPALVTPTVIETTYGVAGVTVDRASKNRQAVAEFHGQTMNR